MAEAIESQSALRRSPLEDAHGRAGAQLREDGGCVVPASYGDAAAEYEAVRGGGAGLFDLSPRGRVEVSGAEAVQFLNGMLTNDVAGLEEGAWMHAAFPNPQGRLVASTRVLKRGGAFLFDTEPATYPSVLKHLERFTLAGDFRVQDLTAETALLSVQGARAAEMVTAATGEDVYSLARGRVTFIGDGRVGRPPVIIRATHTAEDGFDIFVSADEAPPLRQSLLDAGAKPCGL